MRRALVVVLLVSFAAATHFTYTISTQTREGVEGYLNLESAMRSINAIRNHRELTLEEKATKEQSEQFRWQASFGVKLWQTGSFILLAFGVCTFAWFMAVVISPPREPAWTRIQWVTAASIWVALLGGIVCVPVVPELDWHKMEMRWFIGAVGGAILGALLGTLTMGMRNNWQPRRYKANSVASDEASFFSVEQTDRERR